MCEWEGQSPYHNEVSIVSHQVCRSSGHLDVIIRGATDDRYIAWDAAVDD